ncbi:Nucleotide-binding universal stress protein, UspA family [Saccharopolyspora shandongensis]|uniref:Nucleotide-binding universal stress protein, UspA family n=1 Tax=Saccharopolyspora shandongensis TaxID=418495 RepID=A0A1H3QW73_9PSEU|nr:universal stress protein [Saccharopolyspora shandongensis]SDZ17842.1 Nucleotide-binding universal stress protein, UspA family [Saccharopolyspora shandongensis]
MAAERKMPVLVGVDGSEQSLVAAQWAVMDGDLRTAPVRLVTVVDDASRDDAALELLSRVAEQCRSDRPRVEVFDEIKHGLPIENLVWASSGAQLLVVGSRGRGQVAEAVLGSVSTAVAMHAHCPVVVVRDRRTSFAVGPVVVGVDDSAPARAALRFAFEEAAARQTDLLAMHIWRPVLAEYSWIETPQAGAAWFSLDDAQRELDEQLATWREKYPNVEVRNVVRYGHPVEELTKAASHGQLLVVGHRGIGGFKQLLLGSVAHGVLHHSECPVAIVRSSLTP